MTAREMSNFAGAEIDRCCRGFSASAGPKISVEAPSLLLIKLLVASKYT